jgi:hypothetical protein
MGRNVTRIKKLKRRGRYLKRRKQRAKEARVAAGKKKKESASSLKPQS